MNYSRRDQIAIMAQFLIAIDRMSPNSKVALDEVQWLVWLYLGWTFWLASGYAPQPEPLQRQPVRCAECGGEMRIVGVVNTDCRALIEYSVAFLDSG